MIHTPVQQRPKWLRVNRQNPCVVCGKFDRDTYCPALKLACCMRVVSNRPSRNGGFLHQLDGIHNPILCRQEPTPGPTIDARKLMAEFARDTRLDALHVFAVSLGVASAHRLPTGRKASGLGVSDVWRRRRWSEFASAMTAVQKRQSWAANREFS